MNVYPANWQSLNVVLCHDWLTGMRGGERVLEILCKGFPDAPIYTLIHNAEAVSEAINAHPIHTSRLQGVPGIMKRYRRFLPLFPLALSRLRPPRGKLLISTSHCIAKGLRPPPGARHLCYCFTPMRYAWTFYDEYFGKNPAKALLFKPMLAALRAWDRRASAGVDRFVAISRHVQQRIRTFYGRDAEIVHPPVDTQFYTPGNDKREDFDLVVSALVPYKRIDLAVRAYTRAGRRLTVVGVGGERAKLKALAGPTVEFLDWQPDDAIRRLYRRCRCLVFPGEEDFGIVPLEAQACGCPVVAYGKGGALETVREGSTGLFFAEQTGQALAEAVERCAATDWDAAAIRANAERFGVDRFIAGMDRNIRRCLL